MDLDNILFSDHPNPMIIFDANDLGILKVNKVFVEKYGYSESEAQSLTIEDIRPEEDISILHQKLNSTKDKSSTAKRGTVRHQTKSGDIIFVQVTSQQFEFRDRDARIAHIYDISETVDLKNKYKATLDELIHHIDENPMAMIKFNQDLEVTDWSKRAETTIGYTDEEVKGKTPLEINLFPKEEYHIFLKKNK